MFSQNNLTWKVVHKIIQIINSRRKLGIELHAERKLATLCGTLEEGFIVVVFMSYISRNSHVPYRCPCHVSSRPCLCFITEDDSQLKGTYQLLKRQCKQKVEIKKKQQKQSNVVQCLEKLKGLYFEHPMLRQRHHQHYYEKIVLLVYLVPSNTMPPKHSSFRINNATKVLRRMDRAFSVIKNSYT